MSGGRKVGGNMLVDRARKYMPAVHSVLENLNLMPSPVGDYATAAHDVNQALVAVGMGRKSRKPRVHKMVFHGGMSAAEIYDLLKANKAGIHFVLDTVVPNMVPSQKEHASSLSKALKMVGLGNNRPMPIAPKKGPLRTVADNDVYKAIMKYGHYSEQVDSARKIAKEIPYTSGGKRPPTKHALAVRRVMQEHGMKLGEASKYVKMHGLGK